MELIAPYTDFLDNAFILASLAFIFRIIVLLSRTVTQTNLNTESINKIEDFLFYNHNQDRRV